MGSIIVVVLVLVVGVAAYVRLSPLDVEKWHNPKLPKLEAGEHPSGGSFVGRYVQQDDGQAALARVHEVAVKTPRTQVLAGSVAEGKISYVTRTRGFGFPDVTTVTLLEDAATGTTSVQIYARLRYGKKDLGVNKTRVRDWVARAKLAE